MENGKSLAIPPAPLAPFEAATAELFVRLAQLVGLPRSIGEIFGLLFASAPPLTLDDLVLRLQISKGSASQGLKFLRSIGAIRSVYVPGDRRDHFVPETELRQLVSGLLRERVGPHLESGARRLNQLAALLPTETSTPDTAELRQRLGKLAIWHRKALDLLPFLQDSVANDHHPSA